MYEATGELDWLPQQTSLVVHAHQAGGETSTSFQGGKEAPAICDGASVTRGMCLIGSHCIAPMRTCRTRAVGAYRLEMIAAAVRKTLALTAAAQAEGLALDTAGVMEVLGFGGDRQLPAGVTKATDGLFSHARRVPCTTALPPTSSGTPPAGKRGAEVSGVRGRNDSAHKARRTR